MVSLDGGSADKVDGVTASRKQDGGYALLWKRYGNNKMAAMRIMSLILQLQQYSHRLNLFLWGV